MKNIQTSTTDININYNSDILQQYLTFAYSTYLTIMYTYLLTYSMEHSPSWEANKFSASQESPHILWNPKVHCRSHKLRSHVFFTLYLIPLERGLVKPKHVKTMYHKIQYMLVDCKWIYLELNE
jgi:hypothetical protein